MIKNKQNRIFMVLVAVTLLIATGAVIVLFLPKLLGAKTYEYDVYRVEVTVVTTDPQAVADKMADLVDKKGWACFYQCNLQVTLLEGRNGVKEVHLYVPRSYFTKFKEWMETDIGNVRFGDILGSQSELIYVRIYLKTVS